MQLSTTYSWTLAAWLTHITKVHSTRVELGLNAVRTVAKRLALLEPTCPVIIVGGTNGKGSTVAGLERLYTTAGFQTGVFTSPYLLRYNEEIAINGLPVTDEALCEAFVHIEAARETLPLTIFEYGTLASLYLFQQQPLDVVILEVGLGGRLDAVNIIDADLTVITNIGLDHTDRLGDTREKIAYEKAGIFRSKQWAVCGDSDAPMALINQANLLGTALYQQGRNFYYQETPTDWSWHTTNLSYHHLPYNALLTQNMATVLMAVHLLQNKLPMSHASIVKGLQNLSLPGRIEVISGEITEIYDVAHNPDAMKQLQIYLTQTPIKGKTYAVFSMLQDKAIAACIHLLKPHIDHWLVAPLTCDRAAPLAQLMCAFEEEAVLTVTFKATLQEAYHAAKIYAKPGDRVLIVGSFYTVSAIKIGL